MIETNIVEDLTRELSKVGFSQANDVLLTGELSAKHWGSSYAHLFLANLPSEEHLDWPALLADVDGAVLKRIRADEFQRGGVIDAHVCFVVHEKERIRVNTQLDDLDLRNVSRKYWISTDDTFSALRNRLTLLGAGELPELNADQLSSLTPQDQAWIDIVTQATPTEAFKNFLQEGGCER